jgi:hypothetical protein
LSRTSNTVLTHWTYCVIPAAPFVSGGAPRIVSLGAPIPSWLKPRATASGKRGAPGW